MKRWIHSATEVKTYRNKRNPHKYLEVHDDGYGHRSAKQYMHWNSTGVTNPTGDDNLHRWRKGNLDELLDDYEQVGGQQDQDLDIEDEDLYSSTQLEASGIVADGTIQEGLQYHRDGHAFEVIDVAPDHRTCTVTEDWIAEDTGEEQHSEYTYIIDADDNGQEYIYPVGEEKYARPGSDDYSWWARMYASGADNYPYDDLF